MNTNQQIAFPRLTPEQIDLLRPLGAVRRVAVDDVLFEEGDRGFDFFVLLSGKVEISEASGGAPAMVTVHVEGEFTGDVDMLTGRAALVTARVIEAGEVLVIPQSGLREIVGNIADVSELLLRAFLMRRTLLLDQGYEGIKIIGSRYSPEAHRLRDFATRNAVPFTWLDLERDRAAESFLCHLNVRPEETPVVIGRNGELFRNPSLAEFASCVGLDGHVDPTDLYDLVIVGSGPAGLAAAVYAASEGLRTFVVEGTAIGGQAGTSTRIENYLGFPAGISGTELMRNATLQAQKFGATISVPRSAVELRLEPGRRVVRLDDGQEVAGRCVLVSSGAEYRRLDVPDLERFEGAGVYYAVTESESRLCQGEEVALVGGGNAAGQAAVHLAGVARTVHLVVRSGDLTRSMSRYLVDRIRRTPNIEVWNRWIVGGLSGARDLEAVRLESRDDEAPATLSVKSLFVFIGALPHSDWLADCVRLDNNGFVLTGAGVPPEELEQDRWRSLSRLPFMLETSLPGVMAAGDVRSGSIKRVSSAVGEGAMAVTFVHRHLGAQV